MQSKSVNLMAPLGKTGYGVAAFNIFEKLMERDWLVSLFLKGSGRNTNRKEIELINKALTNADDFDYMAPCLNIWHQFDLAQHIGYGKYIAFPFFELDRFSKKEIHHLSYPDLLLVSSKWAKSVVESNGIKTETKVVPLGIDTKIFNPGVKKEIFTNSNDTIFLNCGKWEVRKGHDLLVEIFTRAFNPTDRVQLWLMPHNPFLSQVEHKDWENVYLDTDMGRAGKIKIFPWRENQEEVATIMASADCGIFPSRAEGWNLELLEMMSLGKPVITTNYSAHTEYCDKYNSYLVNIEETEPAYDGKWFFEQGNWAKIEDKHINKFVEYMREINDIVQTKQGLFINDAGIETGRKYSWDGTADIIEEILLDILSKAC